MVVLSTVIAFKPDLQAVVMALCAALITGQLLASVGAMPAARTLHLEPKLCANAPNLLSVHAAWQTWASQACLCVLPFTNPQVPFYVDLVNHVWIGLWCGIVYTCIILVSGDRVAVHAPPRLACWLGASAGKTA